MKKVMIVITILLLTLSFYGCSLTTPKVSTTTFPTFPSFSSTTEILTTEDLRINLINEKYLELETSFPTEISEDVILPNITDEDYEVKYYLDETLLIDNNLSYKPQSFDETIEVSLDITYQEKTLSFSFELLQLRDEDLFNEELLNQKFLEIIDEIRAIIPEVIFSDMTIPEIDILGVELSISTDKSYIYDNRLIFTFPENDEVINLAVDIEYNREVRTVSIPVIMSDFSHLPKIPEIYILTDESLPIETKEEYVYGYLDLFSYDEFNNSILELGGARMGIKLRGNSTLFMPKLPYKIKFEQKQEMLSDYDQKDWVLLANFADQTLVRNAIAFNMSNGLNLDFTPMVRFVDLYINGVYQGNYLLTDQVEVSSNRVNVEEGSFDIDTGYLIEYDYRLYDEGLDVTEENFFLVEWIPFVIKSPDISDDNYSHDQYLFISSYMQMVYNTLKNHESYNHLIDEASFIDWFIVNEVMKNVDSGYSSVYFYKEKQGLLKMGPVWDFDLSSGNYGHLQEDLRGPEGWYTARYDKNIFFMYLMEYEGFRTNLKTRWNEVYEEVVLKAIDNIYSLVDMIARSRYLNFSQWNIIGTNSDWYTSPEILALDTYEEQVFFLVDFLNKRASWLNEAINDF
ncbi:MAG: CotH kinase family protein [Candidatus Izemoplasmatales bacterium]